MKLLYTLAGLLICLALCQLAGCTPARHAAQAPRPARHIYHQAQRRHAHERRRTGPLYIPWN